MNHYECYWVLSYNEPRHARWISFHSSPDEAQQKLARLNNAFPEDNFDILEKQDLVNVRRTSYKPWRRI